MIEFVSRFFCALPHAWAYRIGRALAWLWYYLVPLRRRVARRNVERAFGDTLTPAAKRRIVRQSCENLVYTVIEGLRAPLLDANASAAWVDNPEMWRMRAALARGKGVIGVTAHLGNCDLLGTSLTSRGFPVHAVLKDIKSQAASAYWNKARAAGGLGRIPPRQSALRIVRLLAKNQVVAFTVDQHLPPHRSIVTRFFGQWAATTPAPARLALRLGTPVLPIFIVRTERPGYHRIITHPELAMERPYADEAANVRHNTERLNRIVEAMVRRYPGQWLWQHKRWKVQDAPQGWQLPTAQDAAAAP